MTYIGRDGQVLSSQPWGIQKALGILWAVVDLIVAYFQTLISPWTQNDKPNNNFGKGGASRGSGGGGGGGGGGGFFWRGGGGGGGGGPRGPPKPPPRRNIHGMSDIRGPPNAPPACGSCCG